MLRLLIVAFSLLMLSACAKVYTAPDARQAIRKHQVLAVIPPKVSIAASRKVSAEAIARQQELESENFQREIAAWLLKRKQQNRLVVDIQETDKTYALLERNGYFEEGRKTPQELIDLLGVDAIITSNISMAKPMSTGVAIAAAILVGYSNTNTIGASMVLYDTDGSRLWTYDHSVQGGLGSTTATVTNALMRNASKKLPYIIR